MLHTGPEQSWQNINIGVNVILKGILPLTRGRHIVSSKSITVQTKM